MENFETKVLNSDVRMVEIAFGEVPNITAFLNSIRTADDRTLRLRMEELRKTEMDRANWNVFGIAARVVLHNHPVLTIVLNVVQKNGGIWVAKAISSHIPLDFQVDMAELKKPGSCRDFFCLSIASLWKFDWISVIIWIPNSLWTDIFTRG